jgi:hypothetical protein
MPSEEAVAFDSLHAISAVVLIQFTNDKGINWISSHPLIP